MNKTKELKCLKLEGNTLGIDAAKVIGDALAKHPEFEQAHWKDLFTGRLKTEIPEALVSFKIKLMFKFQTNFLGFNNLNVLNAILTFNIT